MNFNEKEMGQVLISRKAWVISSTPCAVGLEDEICCFHPGIRARAMPSLPLSNMDNLRPPSP